MSQGEEGVFDLERLELDLRDLGEDDLDLRPPGEEERDLDLDELFSGTKSVHKCTQCSSLKISRGYFSRIDAFWVLSCLALIVFEMSKKPAF